MSAELERNEPNSRATGEAPAAGVDLPAALNTAFRHGRYLVTVWHVADGRVHLFRTTNGFPHDAVPVALDLLQKDLAPLGPSGPALTDGAPSPPADGGPSNTDDPASLNA